MSAGFKTRENLLRRMAGRQGYRLEKSRSRDPRALGFGKYKLTNTITGTVELGEGPYAFNASFEDVYQFLMR